MSELSDLSISNDKKKILWISPVMTGEGNRLFNQAEPPTGGWTQSLWTRLCDRDDLQMAIAAPTVSDSSDIMTGSDDSIYLSLPKRDRPGFSTIISGRFRELLKVFQPDVIHIHGTEYPYGREWIRLYGNERVVISIQGLLSQIADSYLGGIDASEFPLTFRDLIKRDSPPRIAEEFRRRGEAEKDQIRNVSHIIGRTSWDKTNTLALNPRVKYHYGGETLREPFYKAKWSYDRCVPHTIFLSQGYYPLKGLHKVIEALPEVIREFPDTKIRLAGINPFGESLFRRGGYGAYLARQTKRLKVGDRIEILGSLPADRMLEEYLRANLFIVPSSLENSPNSLGEARMLEMPVLASNRGGIPDLVRDCPDILYEFDDTKTLAEKIKKVFRAGKDLMTSRAPVDLYDPERNVTDIMKIYREVAADFGDTSQ